MSSSTMNVNNNHVAASTTQKYLPQLPMQHQHRPQHASPTKLIKLSPAQLFVLSKLRPQISMKTVEHDPLVAASAVRSKEKTLFIASTESTERYTVTSSITTHSKTKCKKKAVIKKGNDYLVALSAARSERMLRDRRNRSKLMLTKKRDARNNCLVALSEMSPTEHSPVYRNTRSKKNVTSSTSPPSNVIINDMPPTTAVPSPRPAMQPSTDQPVKEQPSKTAEELKADINNHLNKRPPVFVLGGDYVRQRIIQEQQPLLSSPPSPPSPILQQPQQQSPSKPRKKSLQLDQPRRQSLRIQQQHQQQQQQQQQGCINQAKRGGVCWRHEAKRSSSDESTAFGSEFDMTTVPLQSTTDSLHERSTIGVPREVVVCREIVEV